MIVYRSGGQKKSTRQGLTYYDFLSSRSINNAVPVYPDGQAGQTETPDKLRPEQIQAAGCRNGSAADQVLLKAQRHVGLGRRRPRPSSAWEQPCILLLKTLQKCKKTESNPQKNWLWKYWKNDGIPPLIEVKEPRKIKTRKPPRI